MDKKLKLAIADDNLLHLKVIELMARKSGLFELIFVCHDGKELVQLLDSSTQLPDVCILDLHMPQMDGIKTANLLRQKYPHIKLFGHSASESVEEKKRFLDSGVNYIFSKHAPMKMLKCIYHYTKLCENMDFSSDFEKKFNCKWNYLNQLER